MKQDIKIRILDSIANIYEQANGCKLEPSFFDKMKPDLKQLSDYFNTTRFQSLIVAMVFTLNYKDIVVDLNDLVEYFECNPIKLLKHSNDFKILYSKGILKKETLSHRIKLTFANDKFTINEKIIEAILDNMPLPSIALESSKDVFELIEAIQKLGELRVEHKISTETFFSESKELIATNLHLPLINRINDFNLCIEDTIVYIYQIWFSFIGFEHLNILNTCDIIFDSPSKNFNFIQKLLANENSLIVQNLTEIEEDNFFSNARMRLTEYSVKMLQEYGIKLFANKIKKDNIIEPEKIIAKTLYFNDFEDQQLDFLKRLLQEENLKKTQSRLQNKGLPKGVTVLLHGLPGTGKTETVLQIAKLTKREIIKVDISNSKSMWFGESEKIIKRIFTDYKTYSKDCELLPILLFNEADAVISKRIEGPNSPLAQTENAIQNILLEEMETFEGIFFATTNLVKNLDTAFERRFLFKIEFQKPEILVKAKIWKSKLPTLSITECESLAAMFDFSGGQIDNIVRKTEVFETLNGISSDFSQIKSHCNAELLLKSSNVKIGFTRAKTSQTEQS